MPAFCHTQLTLDQRLFAAVRTGALNMASYYLRLGANIECLNDYDFTPLIYAAHHGTLNMVGFLLSQKANIHAMDNIGCTALHWAASQGHIAVTRLLLGNDARVWVEDEEGRTPYDSALLYNNHALANLLDIHMNPLAEKTDTRILTEEAHQLYRAVPDDA